MKTLLLIDANSLIHRSFHALPPLTSPDGRATNALYGLSSILLRLWREEKPEYAAALFDRPEPTFRKKEYEAYKAQRPKAPDALVSQIIEAHTLFKKFGISVFEKPGYEADDLIATVAERFRGSRDAQVVILTGDLDTLQLVEDGTVLVRTFKKGISDTTIYDTEAVLARYGLPPEKLPEYKALVGDQSDNVKGIPGVGPKTATALLKRYGDLEGFLKNIEHEPKFRDNAGEYKKQAELSLRLVTLRRDVPLPLDKLEELAVRNDTTLPSYFEELGFDSLLKRMRAFSQGKNDAIAGSPQGSPRTLFSVAPDRGGPAPGHIVIVRDAENVSEKDATSSLPKVGFDLKRVLKTLRKRKQELLPPCFDLGVAFWLIDADFKSYDPDSVFKAFLNHSWNAATDDFLEAFRVATNELERTSLLKIFEEIEMPLLPILAQMEEWGIGVSESKLDELEKKIGAKLDLLTKKIYEAAGGPLNINSPQQLAEVLFEKLHIAGGKRKTAGGKRSTNAAALEELKGEHPIVGLILNYREDFKIQSTYVKALRGLLGKDHRIHTEFVQTGASTGRLSSQEPNLQNIPKESVWSTELREAFEAAPGFSLVSCDYSQMELRILAALSGDTRMQEAFQNGSDIHQMTAAKIFNVPPKDVQPEMRRTAKILNFGLIYGMGASALSQTSGLSRKSAAEFIETYFREFPAVRVWQEETRRIARSRGYVETVTGRRRYLRGIESGIPRLVAEAERAAVNHPVQGTNADILKLAMIKVHEMLVKNGMWGKQAKMLLTIHDELLFEIADDMIEEIVPMIVKAMETAYSLSVPLRVEAFCGKNWGAMHSL